MAAFSGQKMPHVIFSLPAIIYQVTFSLKKYPTSTKFKVSLVTNNSGKKKKKKKTSAFFAATALTIQYYVNIYIFSYLKKNRSTKIFCVLNNLFLPRYATDKCSLKHKIFHGEIFFSTLYFLLWITIFLAHEENVKKVGTWNRRRMTPMSPPPHTHTLLVAQIADNANFF